MPGCFVLPHNIHHLCPELRVEAEVYERVCIMSNNTLVQIIEIINIQTYTDTGFYHHSAQTYTDVAMFYGGEY